MIAAIEKAESLYKFASSSGAHLSTFVLALSVPEGMELLDWLVEQNDPNELLDADIAIAKAKGDPFDVLSNFTLLGLNIARADLVLN